jgi:hypothetical protein
MALFYESAGRGLQVARDRSGMLQANLGNGIVLQSTQKLVMEPDENGRMGRMDAYSMVRAADGTVLSAEFGGDDIPKAWEAALDRPSNRDPVTIASDFGRAATALQALSYSGKASKGVVMSQRGEQDAMQRLARSLASSLLPDRGPEAKPGLTAALAAPSAVSDYGLYQTTVEVWRMPFVLIAQHSGTSVKKYKYYSSTGRWNMGSISFCNHGKCPYASPMTRKCIYTGPRLSYFRVPYKSADGGTCTTPYWATGRYGHHNCHDDSSVQVKAVRGISYSTTGGRCGSLGFSPYAPDCSGG